MPYINRKLHREKLPTYKHNNQSSEYYNSIYWQNIRNAYIVEHPLCEVCLRKDIIKPADHIHHIKPFLTGTTQFEKWDLLLNKDNLIAVCVPCHKELHRKLRKTKNVE